MLSRAGGAVAFQKVVNKVSDLPSPLDAEPGLKIIVRETEEVYGLNAQTRMWEVIGTLKKVGGKKPEEIAAHIDEAGNPHGTTLQQVFETGTEATISQEIVITGKKGSAQLRLLSGSAAVRVGNDAGSKEGIFWVNAGRGSKTVLRVVDADGEDKFVIASDGSLTSGGSARFGSFKGAARFEDEITAVEGVHSAGGYDLVLGGDKGVVLRVGGEDKALLTKQGLSTRESMTVGRDLSVGGLVTTSLHPRSDSLELGTDEARWARAAFGDLSLAGSIQVKVAPNSKAPPLQIVSPAPGHGTTLLPTGELGLGTDAPEKRLDVRGEAIVGSGDSRLIVSGTGLSCAGWSVSPGSGDSFSVAREGKNLLDITKDGSTLTTGLRVTGNLFVGGGLCIGGVDGPSGQRIEFRKRLTAYDAGYHSFTGAVRIESEESTPFSVGEVLTVKDGDLVGKGGALKGWESAQLGGRLVVGDTILTNGAVSCTDAFVVNAPALAASNLRLVGGAPKISVTNELVLEGTGGKAYIELGGPMCGITFEGRHWTIEGLDKLAAGTTETKSLKVEGGAEFCEGTATLSKQGLRLAGALSVGGLGFKKIEEELELIGEKTPTKLVVIPEGVRVEAVVLKLKTGVSGARFLQVGDLTNPDRFAGPVTNLSAGAVIRGLNHCDRGQSVQRAPGPVVVSCDAPATGKVLITVYYVDPAAL
jgi:hypothetical protein